MTRRASRTALLAVLALLAGTLGAVSVAAPAVADEVYPRPANGVYALQGHGWGHGHGLSQWGAQGAASHGLSASTILAGYYPGTTSGTIPPAPIRVLLGGTDGVDTTVYPGSDLTATDTASGNRLVLPAGPSLWRVTAGADGLHLAGRTGGGWTAYRIGGRTAVAGPVRLAGPQFVRVLFPDGSSRDYRGAVQAARSSNGGVVTVDVLSLEDYLLGVVPRESSSSWAAAALQAQAVAARSYSAYERAHSSAGSLWDICDSTACQVFGGSRQYQPDGSSTPLEPQSTTAAVQATNGVVRLYQGQPVFAQFSSSDGGWTTDGGMPYLTAHRDDWDGWVNNPVHSWNANLPVSALEAHYPQVGHLTELRVTRRDGHGEWGGRVLKVLLVGTGGSVDASGLGVYLSHPWPAASDGLRSSWWRVVPSTDAGLVGQSAAPTLVRSPGAATGTLTATFRNTGSTSWPAADAHLVVASPPGQADPLSPGPSRLVRNRTRPGASTVQPGDLVDLAIPVDGNQVAPGSYPRAYRLRLADGALFGDLAQWVVPVAAPKYTAAVVSAPGVVVLPRSGSVTVPVVLRNTGNFAWTNAVHLAPAAPRGRTSADRGPGWPSAQLANAVTSQVAPGATGTVRLTLAGNGGPLGVGTESFEPAWVGRHWLDGAPVRLVVVRVDSAAPRLARLENQLPTSVAFTDAPVSAPTLVVRLRNLGGQPWSVGRERLVPSLPALVSAGTGLAANLSRPGATAVLPGEVGEWRVALAGRPARPGKYHLVLQPTAPDGTTYGPAPALTVSLSHAVFSGQLVATHPSVAVPSAGSAATWFDVRNTGNVAWPVDGAVRSTALAAGGSPSRAASWLGPRRPAALSTNLSGSGPVQPGQVGRFLVVLAGNRRRPGSATEPFGLVWEGYASSTVRAVLPYQVQ